MREYERIIELCRNELIEVLSHVDISILAQMALELRKILDSDGTLFAFGCGGSAADAQHFAAEVVGRFRDNELALPAVALNDVSCITAIANDFGFEEIFARQIRGLAKKGDAVLAISTSGRSSAVIMGAQEAAKMGLPVYTLTGREISTNSLARASDLTVHVPHEDTARIQEVHGFMIHMICEAIDDSSKNLR